MILQSYWRRVSDEWLSSGTARLLFGVAAISIAAVTAVLERGLPENPGVLANVILGTVGVAGALGAGFLWSGMWRYWIRCDSSNRWLRRFSFVVLLIGLWYGAVLYYMCVYVPKTVATARERFAR